MCQTCNNLRFVRDEGALEVRPCPECYADAVLRPVAHLPTDAPRRLSGLTRYEHIAPVIDAAIQVLRRPVPSGLFVMAGSYGIGKSYLAMAMCNVAINRLIPARYYVAEELLSWLREAMSDDLAYYDRSRVLREVPVLCIDEFTRYKASEWATTQMVDLVGARYRRRAECLTIIAYNSDTGALNPYFESRFQDQDGHHFHIVGPDLRQLRAA